MASFRDVVALYRTAGKPQIVGGRFSYAGANTSAIAYAISQVKDLPNGLGRFEEEPTVEDGELYFSWHLAEHESAHFYNSIDDLIRDSGALSNGTQPTNFYLVDDDFMDGESPSPPVVDVAFRICEMVRLLGKLAFSHRPDHGRAQLFFILPAGEGKPPRTIELRTQITPEMLSLPEANIQPLRDLLAEKSESSIHVQEHRQLFRLSVADLLSEDPKQPSSLRFLYEAWPRVLELYAVNADCYVHKFSFEKLRQDIASTSLDFATKLSKVLSDSATKMLALPLSVAAIVAVQSSESQLAATLSVIGSTLLSLLLAGLIHNQLLELKRIRQSFQVVAGPLGREANDESLKTAIAEAKTHFAAQSSFLWRLLWTARVLAWTPTLGALGLYAWRYSQ